MTDEETPHIRPLTGRIRIDHPNMLAVEKPTPVGEFLAQVGGTFTTRHGQEKRIARVDSIHGPRGSTSVVDDTGIARFIRREGGVWKEL